MKNVEEIMGALFHEFNEAKWEQVRHDPYFAKTVAAITRRTEEMLASDPPRVRFSDIHLFVTTGNRTIFQNVYSAYQSRMENYFFMYLLTGDEKYLPPLADILWNICDFESWSIPAHVSEKLPPERRRTNLDLTSTIMGFRIAEILHFIGDKLPPLVERRCRHEVRERVIESYAKYDDFWWMRAENNWSAVCIGATLAAYLYIGEKEETDAQLPRMLETIRCYLRGFDDEGCCREGYGYWNYGFSHFCLFASLLREYTDGKINLFDDPKVHAIALFQQNTAINDTQCISFSDCGRGFHPSGWLSHFLKNEYPDMEIPAIPPSEGASGVLRYILWQDPALAQCEMHPASHIFHSAQWFIFRSDAYNFACKAGSNGEPHNHNDVGSFLISKNGDVSFTDPGGGEYTRQYFSSERYTILATSSRGHSVPIVNGEFQAAGNRPSVIFEEAPDRYAFSMENAYNVPPLRSLRRRFVCGSDEITLTDTYDFSETPQSIVERFVSMHKPERTADGVRCGESTLVFDDSLYALSFGEEELVHSSTSKEPVYFIDLRVKQPATDTVFTVRFR